MREPRVFHKSPHTLPGSVISIVKRPTADELQVPFLGVSFDLSNLAYVEFSSDYGTFYPAIARDELEAKLRKYASENDGRFRAAYVRHYDTMREWKQDSGTEAAYIHETRFKKGLGIDRPSRKPDSHQDEHQPTDSAVETAVHFHEISKEFVKKFYGDDFVLFRGITRNLPRIVKEIIAHYPDSGNSCRLYPVKTNALENFTISRTVADTYGVVRLERAFKPGDVALATDSIYYKEAQKGRKTDGEIQIRGDRIQVVGAEQLHIPELPPDREATLSELLLKLNADDRADDLTSQVLTIPEHAVMLGITIMLSQEGITFDSPEVTSLFHRWFDCFFTELGESDRQEMIDFHGKEEFERLLDVFGAIAKITGEEVEIPLSDDDPERLF